MEKVKLITERCKGCYNCIRECPVQAIKESNKTNSKGYIPIEIDLDTCIVCGTCYRVCPDYVFEINKSEVKAK